VFTMSERRFERIFVKKVRVKKVQGRNIYEITIPKDVAESLGLEVGDYVEIGIRRIGK